MMKLGDKRGQFYLIVAVVIIAVLIGMSSLANFSRVSEAEKLERISKELKYEGEKVIDYEVYNSDPTKLEDFTKKYSEYAGRNIEIYFITGNLSSIDSYYYDENLLKQQLAYDINSNKLNVTINEVDYNFEINKGENFYFILTENMNGESRVVVG